MPKCSAYYAMMASYWLASRAKCITQSEPIVTTMLLRSLRAPLRRRQALVRIEKRLRCIGARWRREAQLIRRFMPTCWRRRLASCRKPARCRTRSTCDSRRWALRRAAGDRQREGINLRLLGVLHRQWSGDKAEYLRFARAAVEMLKLLGPSGELAKAYASLSHVHCLLSNYDEAIDWGARAVHLARASSDLAALALALNRHGTAQLYKTNDADARAQLERALALAIDAQVEELAAEIFISLQTGAIIHHDHAFALEVGGRGIAYCEARDLDGYAISLRCRCAYSLVSLGHWDEGEQQYALCVEAPNTSALVRATCEYALRRQQVRRGTLPVRVGVSPHSTATSTIFGAEVRTRLHTLQVEYKPPAIAAACVEAAWLRGDHAAALELTRNGLADALAVHDGRLAGPLLVWSERLGVTAPGFEGPLLPACSYELAGDRAGAAAEWDRLNNPYECAVVLAFGDAEHMRSALTRFTTLGAERAAAITRNRMRALGVRRIERGPYAHARNHFVGFTRRENEVAELLCQGLSNSDRRTIASI